MERADGGIEGGGYRLEPDDGSGATTVVVTGDDPQAVLVAGLRGVLALAVGKVPVGEGSNAELAAPVEAQGADLAETFGGLADALLAQVDVLGVGLEAVRIDGLLETDDGGYSAWGYAVGRERGGPLPRAVELAGPASVTVDERGRIELRCPFRPL
ncbi:MAG: hypothetical protein AVDCRST_MAG59-1385 [uncultured Thermomicrobiales bacterium]|jgi:hypothetical protein|uniref:Uncharacterized protein n=1 Tax=uncultured Thermomicrobiales bacterium TaxID=1645740 RepID=A0A6J4UCA1_9BACT|nr:MAG: hypothetical protein AVDCRST_MAG59-1385 [uncultured Thermomicrobiales bacterium]